MAKIDIDLVKAVLQRSDIDAQKIAQIIEDITLPDSYKTDIYCISDGGYFVADKNGVTMNGETFVIKNGVTTKLCDDNESKPLIFDKSTTKNNRVL